MKNNGQIQDVKIGAVPGDWVACIIGISSYHNLCRVFQNEEYIGISPLQSMPCFSQLGVYSLCQLSWQSVEN